MSRYLHSIFDSRTVEKLNSFVSIARDMTTSSGWSAVDMTVGLTYYLLTEGGDDDDDDGVVADPSIQDDNDTIHEWICESPFDHTQQHEHQRQRQHGEIDPSSRTHLVEQEQDQDHIHFILRNLEFWCHCASITTLVNRMSLRRFLRKCNTELQVYPVVVRYEIAATNERNGYCLCVDHSIRSVLLLINGTQTVQDLLTDMTASASLFMSGHYAHKGFQQSARWFYQHMRHLIRDKLVQYEGYSLRIVGHSAGAGTASLLTLLLDNDESFSGFDIHCLAFACPKVMSLDLARHERTRRLVTSFVLNDDFVPRFSVEAFREFRPKLGDWETRFWASDLGKTLNAVHNKAKAAGVYNIFSRAYSWYSSKSQRTERFGALPSDDNERKSAGSDRGGSGGDVDDNVHSDGEDNEDHVVLYTQEVQMETTDMSYFSISTANQSEATDRGEMEEEAGSSAADSSIPLPPPTEFNLGIELYPAGRIVYIRTNMSAPEPQQSTSSEDVKVKEEEKEEEEDGVDGFPDEIELDSIVLDNNNTHVHHGSPDNHNDGDSDVSTPDSPNEGPSVTASPTASASAALAKRKAIVARVRMADNAEFEKLEKLSKKTLLDHFSTEYSAALDALMMQLLGKKPVYLRDRTQRPPTGTPQLPPPPAHLLKQKLDSVESCPMDNVPADENPPLPPVPRHNSSMNKRPSLPPVPSHAPSAVEIELPPIPRSAMKNHPDSL